MNKGRARGYVPCKNGGNQNGITINDDTKDIFNYNALARRPNNSCFLRYYSIRRIADDDDDDDDVAVKEPLFSDYVIGGPGEPTSGRPPPIYRAS